jgi:hypothetical protein
MAREVKTSNGIEYIEVDSTDIKLGNTIAIEILGRTLDELSIPARNLVELLHTMMTGHLTTRKAEDPKRTSPLRLSDLTFTRKQVRDFTGWTQTRLRNHLKELIDLEYVVLDSGGNGKSLQSYRLLYNGEGQDGSKFIPGCKA